jgi:trk system potassium uptake protein TrkA
VLPAEVLVLEGDATDEALLEEEGIEEVDLFLALTDDDEDNIMSSLLAKRMGAPRAVADQSPRLCDLMHGTQIDIALSPAQAMLGEFLAYVRRGDVQAVHSLRRGRGTGDRGARRPQSSRVVGRKVEELRCPRRCTSASSCAAFQKARPAGGPALEAEVIIPRSHTVIESGDHVVFFLPNKRLVRNVENLFRVSATFF